MTNEESVPIRTVHMPVDMDPETATYVGMLEGTIAALVISDVKNRTLLELLTGDGWEAARVDFKGEAMMALAESALMKQTGMDRVRARMLVARRWQERNHPADYVLPQAVAPQDYATTVQGAAQAAQGSTPSTAATVGARAAQSATSSQYGAPMSERVKDWRARQLADAEKVAQEEAEKQAERTTSGAKPLD